MPRTAAAFALTLTLLTGIVLGQLHSAGSTRSFATSVPNPHASQTATSFYEAINSLLETGDPGDLRSILHAGFIDHSPIRQEPGTSQELEEYLLSLRQISPGLRFAASSIMVQGSYIASRLATTDTAGVGTEGASVDFDAPSMGYELLRIESDRVIERWASPSLPAQVESLASIDHLAPMISPRTPRLERLSLEQYARYEVPVQGGTIIVVESGALNVHVANAVPPGAGPVIASEVADSHSASVGSGKLTIGDAITIPDRASFRLANTDRQPATILFLTIPLFDPVDEPGSMTRPDPLPAGVTRELQVSGFSILPNRGPFTLEMRQMQIAPGTGIANHHVAETEMLLVDQGTIEVTIQDGEVGLLTEQESVANRAGTIVLSPGQGVAAPPDVELAYHATGQSPATFWLITMTPID